MFKPIQIAYPDLSSLIQQIPDSIRERRPYLLPGSEQLLQKWKSGYVLEQWYDSPDSFIQLTQLHTQCDLILPFNTIYHDLYAFHLLSGPPMRIIRTDQKTTTHYMQLHEHQYRLSYLPPAQYQAHFTRGEYLIFYFLLQNQLLFREHSPELYAPGTEPIDALRKRLGFMQLSPARHIPLHAIQRITSYLRRPGTTYLKRLENMQQFPIYLLRQYLQDLQIWHIAEQDTHQLIQQLKDFIRLAIADGHPVSLQLLADQAGLSLSELNKQFVRQESLSLNTYIIRQKLNYSQQLLKQKLPVEQVAHYLNWHPAHFRRIFKHHYGLSPSQYQLQC